MARTSRSSARLVDDQARATMKNEFTHSEAGPLTIERSSRLGVKVLVASGVAPRCCCHCGITRFGAIRQPGRGRGATERRRQRSDSA